MYMSFATDIVRWFVTESVPDLSAASYFVIVVNSAKAVLLNCSCCYGLLLISRGLGVTSIFCHIYL
jgi:hypothetical protein